MQISIAAEYWVSFHNLQLSHGLLIHLLMHHLENYIAQFRCPIEVYNDVYWHVKLLTYDWEG